MTEIAHNNFESPPDYHIVRRRWVTASGLRKLIASQEGSDEPYRTLYVKPESSNPRPDVGQEAAAILREVPASETGLAIFQGRDSAIAISPPFPIEKGSFNENLEPSPLTEIFDQNLTVGVVLLRLGNYAIGVIHGEKLIASKSGSRHVKNRHKQGGSSQRRFERSRQRLVREIFDKACEVMRAIFAPYERRLDYIMLGGEKTTLKGFLERCEYLTKTDVEVMGRHLAVERPGKIALNEIHHEVWKSHVYVLEKVPPGS